MSIWKKYPVLLEHLNQNLKPNLAALDLIYFFIPERPLNFTICLLILCSLSFGSTSANFLFRWSITGLTLKPLSVLSSNHRYCLHIEFWMTLFPIRLSTLQYFSIVGDLLIVIMKFIRRNDFSSLLSTVKFLSFCWG